MNTMRSEKPCEQIYVWQCDVLQNISIAHYDLSHHAFPRHFHSYYVIEWVEYGEDRFYCNGIEHLAQTNDVVCINPGEVHTGGTIGNDELKYYSVCLDSASLNKIAGKLELATGKDIFFNNRNINPGISNGWKEFFQASRSTSETGITRLEETFYNAFQKLLSNDQKDIPLSTRDGRINQLIEFLHENFLNNISITELACMFCMNPYHMIRAFKKATGLSPYEYLINLRIDHAKQLLLKNHNVQEAALLSGFYDASHFNRLFRKVNGISPKNFRPYKCQYRTIFT